MLGENIFYQTKSVKKRSQIIVRVCCDILQLYFVLVYTDSIYCISELRYMNCTNLLIKEICLGSCTPVLKAIYPVDALVDARVDARVDALGS